MSSLGHLIGAWLDVRSFAPPATPRDGTHPWDAYIQAAVDYLLAASIDSASGTDVGTLYLPPGQYLLNRPIQITRAVTQEDKTRAYTFCSIQIVGDSTPFEGAAFHGSVLLAGFTDVPAIVIQCGRAVTLKNLAIVGKNTWTSGKDEAGLQDIILGGDDSKFLAAGVKDDHSHAPYAGICIDPYCLPKPPDTYPGLDSFYLRSGLGTDGVGTSGSSYLFIESCSIIGFVTGIVISPNGQTQNAENISIDNCNIEQTKSAIAICQQQSRSLSCRNLNVIYAKYAIDCSHYGGKAGDCPSIFNANVGFVDSIFSAFSAGSGASIDGMYCEAVRSVGLLGGGGSQDGYSFNGCAFNLIGKLKVLAPNYHFANLARATFNACQFSVSNIEDPKSLLPLWIFNFGFMSLHDCQMGLVGDNALPFWINGGLQDVSFDNTLVACRPLGATLSATLAVDYLSNLYNYFMLPGCFFFPLQESSNSPRWVADGIRLIQLGTPGALKLSFDKANRIATFQPTVAGSVAVGDFIFSSQEYSGFVDGYPAVQSPSVVGKVTAIGTGGLVTVGYVPEFIMNASPDASSILAVVGFYKVHESMKAKVNPGSNTITITTLNPYDQAWIAGDRIRDDHNLIPETAYVLSYDTHTLVLSQNVSLTATPGQEVSLYDANVRPSLHLPSFEYSISAISLCASEHLYSLANTDSFLFLQETDGIIYIFQ